jgi:hypothetical protein
LNGAGIAKNTADRANSDRHRTYHETATTWWATLLRFRGLGLDQNR